MVRYRYGRAILEGEARVLKKKCRTCGLPLPLSAFYRNVDSPDGYRSQCKACRAAADHEYHQAHPVRSGRHKRKAERGEA